MHNKVITYLQFVESLISNPKSDIETILLYRLEATENLVLVLPKMQEAGAKQTTTQKCTKFNKFFNKSNWCISESIDIMFSVQILIKL